MSYYGAYKVFNNESSGNNAPNSTAHDKDKIFDATLQGNMMMVGSTETGKTHLAVKTIENGLWGPGLTTVYWFSPNELSDRDNARKVCRKFVYAGELSFYLRAKNCF